MQTELGRRGVNAKGTKSELVKRLEESDTTAKAAIEALSETAEAPHDGTIVVVAEPVITAPVISEGRLRAADLVVQCNEIMAGRAHALYDDNNPKCIEFHGGPRRRQDVTLAQPDKGILAFAKNYVARMANSQVGEVMGAERNDDQKLFNVLQNLSPDQKQNIIKSLS